MVDVFENYLGDDISCLSSHSVAALTPPQLEELVEVIDVYLNGSRHQEFPSDAVMLDMLTNPIIASNDPSVPKTTRRVKQVALGHREVVIPMGSLGVDYRAARDAAEAAAFPGALLEWCKSNAVLLRNHVISIAGCQPLFEIAGEHKDALIRELVSNLLGPDFAEPLKYVVSPCVSVEERRAAIESALTCVLMDILNANTIDGNLAYVDVGGGMLYRQLQRLMQNTGRAPSPPPAAQMLTELSLPAIDEMPDREFVAIRMQSDDFEEYRRALGRVLAKTEVAASSGIGVQEAFRTNLEEIHVRADQLRREIKDRAARKHIRSAAVGVQLGAVVSTAAALSAEATQGTIRPAALMARFLTSVALASLFAVLTHKAPTGRQRMLRFYEVLLSG